MVTLDRNNSDSSWPRNGDDPWIGAAAAAWIDDNERGGSKGSRGGPRGWEDDDNDKDTINEAITRRRYPFRRRRGVRRGREIDGGDRDEEGKMKQRGENRRQGPRLALSRHGGGVTGEERVG